jgi:TolB protein
MSAQRIRALCSSAFPRALLVTCVVVLAAFAAPTATPRVTLPAAGTIVFGRGDVHVDCHGSLWEIQTDGTNAHELVDSGEGDCDPDVSPDRAKLAFASVLGGNGSIWVANVDGTNAHRVSRGGDDYQPAWSPDGKRIAFERALGDDWELFVMNADGTGLRRIPGGTGFDGTPDWNAVDGDLLVTSSGRTGLGRTAIRCSCSALYRLEPDGSHVRRLTRRGRESLLPQWSANGSAIAWARQSTGGNFSLAVANANTSGFRIIDTIGEDAGWSPDGRWIAYSRAGSLYLIRSNGGDRIRLTSGFYADAPKWLP